MHEKIDKEMMKAFGPKIGELRSKSRLSQEELAEMMGVDPSTIYRWENAKTTMSFENGMKIAAFFHIPFDELFPDHKTYEFHSTEQELVQLAKLVDPDYLSHVLYSMRAVSYYYSIHK